MRNFLDKLNTEFGRYVINGGVATMVHLGVLTLGIEVLKIPFASVANTIAALVGISVSFLGSRYFVFRKRHDPILRQAGKFGLLYSAIAALHAAVLFVWTDILSLNYLAGFGIATIFQVMLSYLGNKKLVFK